MNCRTFGCAIWASFCATPAQGEESAVSLQREKPDGGGRAGCSRCGLSCRTSLFRSCFSYEVCDYPGEPAPDDPLALLWQAVMAEPLAAFDSWMKLAQAGEKKVSIHANTFCWGQIASNAFRACLQGEIEYIRAIYDQFLSHFPLCYGYWKKYADAESRVGDPAKVHPVYERGAAAVPYSVDMWLNYVSYFLGATEDEEAIRRRASCHSKEITVHTLSVGWMPAWPRCRFFLWVHFSPGARASASTGSSSANCSELHVGASEANRMRSAVFGSSLLPPCAAASSNAACSMLALTGLGTSYGAMVLWWLGKLCEDGNLCNHRLKGEGGEWLDCVAIQRPSSAGFRYKGVCPGRATLRTLRHSV